MVLDGVILWPGWNLAPLVVHSRSSVESSVEAANRKLARPVQPKEPLLADRVQAIADA